jgi:ABC-type Fe3+/spermidine/putrescine transport system ATPase subunit
VLSEETAVYVTHNRTTARTLADRVAVIGDGDIVQVGSPEAVFERPASPFVARFTGCNCLDLRDGDLGGVEAVAGSTQGRYLTVRPEHVELDPPDPDCSARVERVLHEDGRARVVLALGDQRCDAYSTNPPESGSEVGVKVPESSASIITD